MCNYLHIEALPLLWERHLFNGVFSRETDLTIEQSEGTLDLTPLLGVREGSVTIPGYRAQEYAVEYEGELFFVLFPIQEVHLSFLPEIEEDWDNQWETENLYSD